MYVNIGSSRQLQKLTIDINCVLIKAGGQDDIFDGKRVFVMGLFQYVFFLFMHLSIKRIFSR